MRGRKSKVRNPHMLAAVFQIPQEIARPSFSTGEWKPLTTPPSTVLAVTCGRHAVVGRQHSLAIVMKRDQRSILRGASSKTTLPIPHQNSFATDNRWDTIWIIGLFIFHYQQPLPVIRLLPLRRAAFEVAVWGTRFLAKCLTSSPPS